MKAGFAQILKNYSVGHCVLAVLFKNNFPGFCSSKSLEDFYGLIFCEILSEIVEIGNGNRIVGLVVILDFLVHSTLVALSGG